VGTRVLFGTQGDDHSPNLSKRHRLSAPVAALSSVRQQGRVLAYPRHRVHAAFDGVGHDRRSGAGIAPNAAVEEHSKRVASGQRKGASYLINFVDWDNPQTSFCDL
jgi:hypothetical protein